jgi:hypothetical protein
MTSPTSWQTLSDSHAANLLPPSLATLGDGADQCQKKWTTCAGRLHTSTFGASHLTSPTPAH